MLRIDPNTHKVIEARKLFHSGMMDFVFKRIDKLDGKAGFNTFMVKTFFDNHILDKIDDILIGVPLTLIELNKELAPLIEISPDIKKESKLYLITIRS